MNQLEQPREQCAKVCDEQISDDLRNRADVCANAIRAIPLPDVRLSIGNTFNERVLNVLGETWNLVSFPLEQPFKAQARSEIMRLMTEIVLMRNEPTVEELRAENEQLRNALEQYHAFASMRRDELGCLSDELESIDAYAKSVLDSSKGGVA
ncbi:hypothetical protein [Undibacterium crateris]|uniref:hypothetical protein n=1 Tax=Undibacterium crateris TaxID=2528175 RepID=UPI00138A02B9|nr:hypothetical protein [Undibacterium crateris]NDI85045.1 hypothetical protein [Undibacterium crateris]